MVGVAFYPIANDMTYLCIDSTHLMTKNDPRWKDHKLRYVYVFLEQLRSQLLKVKH